MSYLSFECRSERRACSPKSWRMLWRGTSECYRCHLWLTPRCLHTIVSPTDTNRWQGFTLKGLCIVAVSYKYKSTWEPPLCASHKTKPMQRGSLWFLLRCSRWLCSAAALKMQNTHTEWLHYYVPWDEWSMYAWLFLCVPQGRPGRPLTERPSHHSASRIHHRGGAQVSSLTQHVCIHPHRRLTYQHFQLLKNGGILQQENIWRD